MATYHGISESSLRDEFNTTLFQIQSKAAFSRRLGMIASKSSSATALRINLKQHQETILTKLKRNAEDRRLRIVARSEHLPLDSTHPAVLDLAQEPSLEGFDTYFETLRSSAQNRKPSPDASQHNAAFPGNFKSMRATRKKQVVPSNGVQKTTQHSRIFASTQSNGQRRSARLQAKSSL
jgi:hypothetical protein